jgi:membrane-associated phospholipid phosphatase
MHNRRRLERYELFNTFWTEAFRLLMPWAELFFRVVTELGSDYFFVVLIAIGFWAVDKQASILTTFVLTASVVSNYWLKITFRIPRPPATNWLPGVHASNYSLPSGHAQNSTTVWGWIAIKIKIWWMAVLSVALIGMIGLSRIYIGVHWLGDVIFGWAVGLLLLIILWKLEEPIRFALSKYNPDLLYFGLVIFGLAAMILTELLSPVTIEGLEANFGPNGGLMIGLGIGLILEKRYVNFKVTPKHDKKWRVVLRVIIGLIMVFAIAGILSRMLPKDVYWTCAIQYALVTIAVIFIWPFLFKKFRL